jgi:hypothetical protein
MHSFVLSRLSPLSQISPLRPLLSSNQISLGEILSYRLAASVAVGERRIDRVAETIHDRVDMPVRHDEWRGKKDMIAIYAIDRSAHRIDHQPARHGLRLDTGMQSARGIKWRLCLAISHEFYGPEQTASADITDMSMLAEPLP